MPVYQIHILTRTDLTADIRELECDDDAAAIAAADASAARTPLDRSLVRWTNGPKVGAAGKLPLVPFWARRSPSCTTPSRSRT
jgi:hypothetical protein